VGTEKITSGEGHEWFLECESWAETALKMAVIPLTDNFFLNFWSQKYGIVTTLLLNSNSTNINVIGVWCSLVQ
jgi:hypothetical protein